MEDHIQSARRISNPHRLRHRGKLLMALLLIVPLAAPVTALPIVPCRMNPDGSDECARAEAWDYYGVTILARQNAIYATVTQSGATYDQPSRPVTTARFDATSQSVDFLRFVRTGPRTGDYYERGSGGTLTKKGTVNLDQQSTIVAFKTYLDAKMGLHPQVQDGRWRDLVDGLRAGASEKCNKATAASGISFLSFLFAARKGNVEAAVTSGLAFMIAYDNQKRTCGKG